MPTAPLRPLGLGEILDGAFTIYRRHFATLVSTSLLGLLPAVFFMVVVFPMAMLAESGAEPDTAMVGLMLVGMLVLFPLMMVGSVVMWGALTQQVSQAYLGEEVSVREGYAHAFRRFFPLLGSMILWGLALTAGFLLCIVPGFLVGTVFFAFVPAVMLERRGPLESLGRSSQLAQGAWGTIFLTLLVVALITYAPGMALGSMLMVGMMVVVGLAESESAMNGLSIGYQILNLLVSALTTPFLVAGITLLYYDRRVRTEALDLEIATGALPAHG